MSTDAPIVAAIDAPVEATGTLSAPGEDHPRQDKRFHRIWRAAASALLGKGTTLLVSVITVPLAVRYLGAESYGLWITISSTVTMFFVFDIGIASTLTNLISEAYASNDRERAAASFATAFWLVLGIAACLGILGWLIWPQLHWASIFHVRTEVLGRETSHAVAAAFIVFLIALPTGLAAKVLGGYQELHAANLFATGGSVLSLLVVLAVVYLHGSLTLLVAGFAGSTVAANAACLLWICLYHKRWMMPRPRLVKPALIGRIFQSGTQFFAIQVAGLVVFSSDNLIIAHYLSPADVTPYAVTWRLVNYITAVQALILPALWPAYSEAHARGHLAWIRSAYSRVRRLTVVILAGGCGVTLVAGREIIRLWAGAAAVPSSLLLWLMVVWIVVFAFTLNQSSLMGATYRVGKQAISSSLAAVANLALSILWVKTMGPAGVLLATIVSYLVFIVAIQFMEVRRILRGDFMIRPQEHGAAHG
jgi:O-antigen/teichoic acid export membrane protein